MEYNTTKVRSLKSYPTYQFYAHTASSECSADEVFSYMAGTTADFKIKVAKAGKEDGQEDRIAGFMADFEAAFDAAKELGLSDEAAFKVLDRM